MGAVVDEETDKFCCATGAYVAYPLLDRLFTDDDDGKEEEERAAEPVEVEVRACC